MMLGFVSEKKDADRIGRSIQEKERKDKQSKRETSHGHKKGSDFRKELREETVYTLP